MKSIPLCYTSDMDRAARLASIINRTFGAGTCIIKQVSDRFYFLLDYAKLCVKE